MLVTVPQSNVGSYTGSISTDWKGTLVQIGVAVAETVINYAIQEIANAAQKKVVNISKPYKARFHTGWKRRTRRRKFLRPQNLSPI